MEKISWNVLSSKDEKKIIKKINELVEGYNETKKRLNKRDEGYNEIIKRLDKQDEYDYKKGNIHNGL